MEMDTMREVCNILQLSNDLLERIVYFCMPSQADLLSPAETEAWAQQNDLHSPLDGSSFSVFKFNIDTHLRAVNRTFRVLVPLCQSKCVQRIEDTFLATILDSACDLSIIEPLANPLDQRTFYLDWLNHKQTFLTMCRGVGLPIFTMSMCMYFMHNKSWKSTKILMDEHWLKEAHQTPRAARTDDEHTQVTQWLGRRKPYMEKWLRAALEVSKRNCLSGVDYYAKL